MHSHPSLPVNVQTVVFGLESGRGWDKEFTKTPLCYICGLGFEKNILMLLYNLFDEDHLPVANYTTPGPSQSRCMTSSPHPS